MSLLSLHTSLNPVRCFACVREYATLCASMCVRLCIFLLALSIWTSLKSEQFAHAHTHVSPPHTHLHTQRGEPLPGTLGAAWQRAPSAPALEAAAASSMLQADNIGLAPTGYHRPTIVSDVSVSGGRQHGEETSPLAHSLLHQP